MSTLTVGTVNATKATFKSLTLSAISGGVVASSSDIADGVLYNKVVVPSILIDVLGSLGPVGSKRATAVVFDSITCSSLSGLVMATSTQATNDAITTKAMNPSTVAAAFAAAGVIGGTSTAAGVFTNIRFHSLGADIVAPIVGGVVDTTADNKIITPASLAAVLGKAPTIGQTTPAGGVFTTITTNALNLNNPAQYAIGGTGIAVYSKGDVISGTGTGYARLPAGTSGQLLMAQNSAQGGVTWNTVGTGVSSTRVQSRLFATNVEAIDSTIIDKALAPANLPTIFANPPAIGGGTPGDLYVGDITVKQSVTLPSALSTPKGGTGFTATALGTMLVGNASGTLTKLAAGTSGQFLKSNPITTTGLEWQTVQIVNQTASGATPQLARYYYVSQQPTKISSTEFVVNDSYAVNATGVLSISTAAPVTVDISATGANGVARSSNLTGTISINYKTPYIVTGSSTTFIQDFIVGDYISFASYAKKIVSIESDTSLTLSEPVVTVGNTAQWSLMVGGNKNSDYLCLFPKFGTYASKTSGNNGYGIIQCVNSSLPTITDFTVEFWVYYSTSASNYTLISSQNSIMFNITKSSDHKIYFTMSTGLNPQSATLNNLNWTPAAGVNNTWCHIAAVFVSNNSGTSTVNVFFNGARVVNSNITGVNTIDPTAFANYYIGSGTGTPMPIDELHISNTARYALGASISVPTAPYTKDSYTINLQHFESFNLNASDDINLTGVSSTTYKRGGVPNNGRLLMYTMEGQLVGATQYSNAYFLSNRDTTAGEALVDIPTGYTANRIILLPYYVTVTNDVFKVVKDPGFRVGYLDFGPFKMSNKISFTIPYCYARNSVNSGDICVRSARTLDASPANYGKINGICTGNLTGRVTSISSGTTVVGSGTSFKTQFKIGDIITSGNNESRRISAIASDTSLTVDRAFNTTSAWENYNSGVLLTGDLPRYGNALFVNNNTPRPISITGIPANVSSAGWTIEFWIMPMRDYNMPGIAYIMTCQTSSVFQLTINNTNTLGWALSSDTSSWDIVNTTGGTLNNRKWNHVALVFDGINSYSLYANGLRAISATSSMTASQNLFPGLVIGVYGVVSSYCTMLIDSIRVSNIARYLSSSTMPIPNYDFVADSATVSLNRFTGSVNNIDTDDIPGVSWRASMPILSSLAKFGSYSYLFKSYYCSALNATGITVPPSAWTMELWLYPLAFSGSAGQGTAIFEQSGASMQGQGDGFGLYMTQTTGLLKLWLSGSGGIYNIANSYSTSGTPTLNAWNHIALVFTGSAYVVYLNGASVGSVSSSTAVRNDTFTYFTIGNKQQQGFYSIDGYIDSVRVSKVARYSSGFTPSGSAFVSDGDTLSLIDFENGLTDTINGVTWASPSRGCAVIAPTAKFGSSMVEVNSYSFPRMWVGNVNYVAAPTWTVEFFLMTVNIGNDTNSLYNPTIESKNGLLRLTLLSPSLLPNLYVNGTWTTSSTPIPYGQWVHLALVFDGSAYKLYTDGALNFSVSSSINLWTDLQNICLLGSIQNANVYQSGFIDSVRVSTTARYSGSYTVPVTPWTSDSYTISLNNFDTTADQVVDLGQIDETASVPVTFTDTTVGYTLSYQSSGATVSTTRSKHGSGSLLLGSTAYMTISNVTPPQVINDQLIGSSPSTSLINPWTVEFYAYPTSTGSSAILMKGFLNNTAGGLLLQFAGATTNLTLSLSSGAGWDIASAVGSTSITIGDWSHIAVVYSGVSYLLFVNGTLVTTVASRTPIASTFWNNITLGDATGNGFVGHIDDLKISSVAKYTGAFTPTQYYLDASTVLMNTFERSHGSTNFLGSHVFNNSTMYSALSNAAIEQGKARFGMSCLRSTGGSLNLYNVPQQLGAWTIEFWIYPFNNVANQNILTGRYNGFIQGLSYVMNGSTSSLYLTTYKDQWDTTTSQKWDITTGNNTNYPSGIPVLNTWSHIAISFSGTMYYMYVNGVMQFNILSSKQVHPNFWKLVSIGGFMGYVDGIRISNISRYTKNFMPPLAAQTNDAYTIYLNNFADSTSVVAPSQTMAYSNKSQYTTYKAMSPGTVMTTAFYKFGTSSLAIGTSGLLLQNIPRPQSAWTIECFCYPTAVTSYNFLLGGFDGGMTTGLQLSFNGGGQTLLFAVSSYGNTANLVNSISSTSLNLNAWNHVAVVFTGTTYYLFINGTASVTVSNSNNIDYRLWDSMSIGGLLHGVSSQYNTWPGYIDSLRISNTARYTAGFTPTTNAFTYDASTLLLQNFDGSHGSTTFLPLSQHCCKSIVYRSNSASNTISTATKKFGSSSLFVNALTSASVYINGIPPFATSRPWTIECWVYYSAARNTNVIFHGDTSFTGTNTGFYVSTNYGNNLLVYLSDTYGSAIWNIANGVGSTASMTPSAWNHVALVYTGTNYVLYTNGVAGVTINSSKPIQEDAFATLTLSAIATNSSWNGYIDELRLSNVARYTTSFTPAGSAFAWDDNTVLLNHFEGSNGSTVMDSSSFAYGNFIATDSTVMSSSQNKFGGSSLNIPGGNEALRIGHFPAPTGAWTIAFWAYAASNTTDNVLLCGYANGSYHGLVLKFSGSTRTLVLSLSSHLGSADIASDVGTTQLSLTTWTHIAVVFTGSSYILFVNGTASGTVTSSARVSPALWNCLQLGSNNLSGNSWNGYIDDLSVSNIARWTDTFAAPSTATTIDENHLISNSFNGTTNDFKSYGTVSMVTPTFTRSGTEVVVSNNIVRGMDSTLYLPTSSSWLGISTFTAPSSVWSLEVWAMYTSKRDQNILVQPYSNNSPQGVRIQMSDNVPKVSLWAGADASSSIATNVGTVFMTPGKWSHVCLSYTGTSYLFYVNGTLSATVSSSTAVYEPAWDCLRIGSVSNSWKGYVDSIRLSNTPTLLSYNPSLLANVINDYTTMFLATFEPTTTNFKEASVMTTSDGNQYQYQIQSQSNAVVSSARGRFDNSSLYCTSSSGALKLSTSTPSGAWTIDLWAATSSMSSNVLISGSQYMGIPTGLMIKLSGSLPQLYLGSAGSWDIASAVGSIYITSSWTHYAVVFSGSTYYFFVNGLLSASASSSTAINSSTWNNLMLSDHGITYTGWNGYIDEVRVSNVARWTSTFAPSSTAYISDGNTLLLQHFNNLTGGFDDGNTITTSLPSGSGAVMTTAVAKFGAASLSLPSANSVVAVNGISFSGPWTIDLWAVITASSSGILLSGRGTSGAAGIKIEAVGGDIRVSLGSASSWDIASAVGSTTLTPGTWSHIAVVFTGTSYLVFVDGTLKNTTSKSTAINAAACSILWIGDGSSALQGNVADFRVSNVARWTSGFAPNSSALTNDYATVYLNSFNSVSPGFMVTDTSMTISGAQKKFGNSSLYIPLWGNNGFSAYGVLPPITPPSGAWTIEFWYYRFQYSGTQPAGTILQAYANGIPYGVGIGFVSNSNQPRLNIGSTTGSQTNIVNSIGNNSLNVNTWTHIAVVFTGTVYAIYVGGAQSATTSSSTQVPSATWANMYIGGPNASGSSNGYIDGLMISNVARYTSGFTPSASAPSEDGNTIYINQFEGSITTIPPHIPTTMTTNSKTVTIVPRGLFGNSSMALTQNSFAALQLPVQTGNWTIEFFVYPTTTQSGGILGYVNSTPQHNGLLVTTNGTQVSIQVTYSTNNASDMFTYNSVAQLPVNTWTHIAVVYSGGWLFYVNGVRVVNWAAAYNLCSSYWSNVILGSAVADGSFTGYIDALRMSNVARYSGATITVPSTIFTTDDNTVYLNNFESAIAQTPTTYTLYESYSGSLMTSSAVKKYGNGSLAFTLGDRNMAVSALSVPASVWTIELWAYAAGSAASNVLLTASGIQLIYGEGGILSVNLQSTSGTWDIASMQGTLVLPIATWTHIALVFDGAAYNLYVGGALSVAVTNTSPVLSTSWSSLHLGSPSAKSWYGYIDDFRVSNVVRYNAAYTPPGSALTRDANTLALNNFDALPSATSTTDRTWTIGVNDIREQYAANDPSVGALTTYSKFGYSSITISNTLTSRYAMSITGFTPPYDAWTLEAWTYFYGTSTTNVLFSGGSSAVTGFMVAYNSNVLKMYIGSSWAVANAVGTVVAPTGQWNHVALVFTGAVDGHYYLFVNGVLSGSATSSTAVSNTAWASVNIGSVDSSYLSWNGSVDDVRLSSAPLYASAFNVPTEPHLYMPSTLFLQSSDIPLNTQQNTYSVSYVNTGNVSIATDNKQFGSASAKFDSTLSNYFSLRGLPNTPNTWTIELWVYLKSWVNNRTILYSENSQALIMYVNANGAMTVGISVDNSTFWNYILSTSNNTLPMNTWTHIALVFTGSAHVLYVNGISKASSASTKTLFPSVFNQFVIGTTNSVNSNFWDGYIDDLRISNVARYLTTFTPPASAFTRDIFTILLNNFNGSSGSTSLSLTEVSSNVGVSYTNVGNASLSTSRAKISASSLRFLAASGQYVTLSGLGTTPSAWTIEFWMQPITLTASTVFTTGSIGVRLQQAANGVLTIGSTSGAGWNLSATTSPISANTWTHIALVYDGSAIVVYVNGTSSATLSSPTISSTAFGTFIFAFDNVSTYWNGYIDELRISKVARYLTTFTPSTAPFAADTNTLVLNHFNLAPVYPSTVSDLNATDSVLSTGVVRGGLWIGATYYIYAVGSNKETGYIMSTRNIANGDALVDMPSPYTTKNIRQLPLVLSTSTSTSGVYPDVALYDIYWVKNGKNATAFLMQDQFSSYTSSTQSTTSANTNTVAPTAWTNMIPTNIRSLVYGVGVVDGTTGGTTITLQDSSGNSSSMSTYGGSSYNYQELTVPVTFSNSALQSYYYMTDSTSSYATMIPKSYTMST